MKSIFIIVLLASPAFADEADDLCAKNPAYSRDIMLPIVQQQLERDHDPSLDADTPEHTADKAVAQGIAECAASMRAEPAVYGAMVGLNKADLSVAWDAFNSACADHRTSKAACITAEVGSANALKRMISHNSPPGAKALAQTCQLVLTEDPSMADWRSCVDQGLAVHASTEKVEACKIRVNYHSAKTGAEAGQAVAACLRAG